jgi:hypothetical protein
MNRWIKQKWRAAEEREEGEERVEMGKKSAKIEWLMG